MGKSDDADRGLMRALAHPLRVQILSILTEQVASPNEMAGLLDAPLGTISYHAKVLLKYECIELVKEMPRRGAVEHFYRAKPHPVLGSRKWKEIPSSLSGDLAAAALDGFTSHAISALKSGAFQAREGSAVSWLPLTVDETGWEELREVIKDSEERFRKIGEASTQRLDDPHEGIPAVVAVSMFQAGDSERRRKK